MSDDEQEESFATSVAVIMPEKDLDEVLEKAQKRQVRVIKHELDMTKLTAELNDAKRQIDLNTERGPREKLEKSYAAHYSKTSAAEDIAEREKAAASERWKGNSEKIAKEHARIQDWLEDALGRM